jgi:hypothetical protein
VGALACEEIALARTESPGTGSSNPVPSSGESSANLTGPRGAAQRSSDRDCPVVIPSGGATGDGGSRALDGVPSLHQAPKFALITAFPFAECHSMKHCVSNKSHTGQSRPKSAPTDISSENCDLPCGAPVPAYCRSGIPVLRSLSPMKVTLRRAPGDACSIRRSDHDKRQY